MARDLENQVNLRAAAEGCPMALVEGRIVNNPSGETGERVLEDFEQLFAVFCDSVGMALGSQLTSGLIRDALTKGMPGNGASFERFFLDRVGELSPAGFCDWTDDSDLKAG